MENGPATPGGWNRRDVSSGEHAPTSDVCWEGDGSVVPLGLLDLAEDEKEVRQLVPCATLFTEPNSYSRRV